MVSEWLFISWLRERENIAPGEPRRRRFGSLFSYNMVQRGQRKCGPWNAFQRRFVMPVPAEVPPLEDAHGMATVSVATPSTVVVHPQDTRPARLTRRGALVGGENPRLGTQWVWLGFSSKRTKWVKAQRRRSAECPSRPVTFQSANAIYKRTIVITSQVITCRDNEAKSMR